MVQRDCSVNNSPHWATEREREGKNSTTIYSVAATRERGEKSRKWCMMQHIQRVWFPVSRNWKFIVPCFCRRRSARVFCTDAMMRDATWNSQSLYPFDGSIAFRIVPLGREPNSHGVQQSSAVLCSAALILQLAFSPFGHSFHSPRALHLTLRSVVHSKKAMRNPYSRAAFTARRNQLSSGENRCQKFAKLTLFFIKIPFKNGTTQMLFFTAFKKSLRDPQHSSVSRK